MRRPPALAEIPVRPSRLSPAASEQQRLAVTFIGNTEVFVSLQVPANDTYYVYWARLYRDGTEMGSFGAGYQGYYEDTGLVQGQTFHYKLTIWRRYKPTGETGVYYTSTQPATTGQVEGTLHRDMTWSGEWHLTSTVTIASGVKLTVAPGATVFSTYEEALGARIEGDGILQATGATLRNLSLIAHVGRIYLRGCTLVDIYAYGQIYDFSNNRGSCVMTVTPECHIIIEFDHAPTAPLRYAENELTDYEIEFTAAQPFDVQILFENNRLLGDREWLARYLLLVDYSTAFGPHSKLTIRNNTLAGRAWITPSGPLYQLEFSNNHACCVVVSNAVNPVIEDNVLDGAILGGKAILIDRGVYGAQIIRNQVTFATPYGIEIADISGLGYIFHDNIIRDNVMPNAGLTIYASYNDTIYNNILAGGALFGDCGTVSCTNTWNVAAAPGPNIVGGPAIGGNWWGDYRGRDDDGDGFGDTPYVVRSNSPNTDYLPLVGALGPDLLVSPFPLSLGNVTFDPADRRYLLSVDVLVENAGAVAAVPAQARFSDNSGWSATQTIPALAPGVSATLHLDWDLTPILLAGQGQNTAVLTVVADPQQALTDTIRGNNTRTGQLTVDARPRIVELKPEYTLNGAYFLDRTDLDNRLRVTVDWNGALPNLAAGPYGHLYFDLNGALTAVPGESWGGAHTYNMGADFQDAFSCANNTLRLYATHGVQGGAFRSLDLVVQPTVFPFPAWVEWAMQNLPGSDAGFDTIDKAPLVQYQYDFKYPEPPFEATWTPPDWVPYLGGEELGILETVAEAGATGQSDGSGTARVEGQTGMAVGGFTAEGTLWGAGETQFVCGESLDLQRAEVGFLISFPVEKELSLVNVVPGAQAAADWPVVGRIIKWVLQVAQVKAELRPDVKALVQFEDNAWGELAFRHGEVEGGLGAKATLAVQPIEGLEASVWGGGRPYLILQVPAEPSYLKELGLDLGFGAGFVVGPFEAEYEVGFNCRYPPGECHMVEEEEEEGLAWRLIPRDYAGPDYARFTAGEVTLATATTAETVLIANVYPYPQPALAVRADGHRLLAYVHDNPALPQGRGAEIAVLGYDGAAWSPPFSLTADLQPDLTPALAYDGAGNGLLLWERSTLAEGITPTLDLPYAQSLEIAAAAYDGVAWSAPVTLTANSLMDRAPRLARGVDGSVLALWETTDGADILGTAAHPLTLTYALWNGTAWSTPTAALAGLQDILAVSVAAYSETEAAIVLARDADGVLTTTADTDLFYSAFDGAAWSAPALIADSLVLSDAAPALAYDAAGGRHLLWLRGPDLAWLHNSWELADLEVVRTGSSAAGFLDLRLAADPHGNLALAWQSLDEDGADVAYRVYDPAAAGWGADHVLLADAAVEAGLCPAFAAGTLYAAYAKVETLFITRTFELSPGVYFTVTGMPAPGASDLALLDHTVGRDLAWDSLAITPTNPAPGQVVTLTAVLRNAGDLAVAGPEVVLYDGAAPLFTPTLAIVLAGGLAVPVEVPWTMPPDTSPHALRAVADPGGLLDETDEENNEITLLAPRPDLQVERFYGAHGPGVLTYTLRLANAGPVMAAPPFTVTLRAADPATGTIVAALRVLVGLGPAGRLTLTQPLTDPLALGGLGEIVWAVADSADTVAEADEDNNTAYASLGVLPDLHIAAADLQGLGPISVTVHNAGLFTATSVVLAVRQDGLSGTLVLSTTLGDLGPGAQATVRLSLPAGAVELWAKADPDDAIRELDEGNNLAIGSYPIQHRVYLPLVQR